MIHDLHGWVVPRVVVSSDNKELHIGRWYIYLSTRHRICGEYIGG